MDVAALVRRERFHTDADYEVQLFPEDVPVILSAVGHCPRIDSSTMQSGVINLETAIATVDAFTAGLEPCGFTIGITAEPIFRFYNRRFPGYFWLGSSNMCLLHVGSPAQGAWLETSLIAYYRLVSRYPNRLQNILGGGQNPPVLLCFTYVVGANASISKGPRRK